MKSLIILIGSWLMVSCAALPAIHPPAGVSGKTFACPSPYLAGKTRFIHAIEVCRAGQAQTAMIGVTLIDPAQRTISSALMSAEGMTFFEAATGPGGLTVSRALPPFDSGEFAQNMMNDIELIFLAPREAVAQKGALAGGQNVCRYKEQGGWIDVTADRDERVHIRRYSEGGSLKRSVALAGGAANPYSVIELQASEMFKYTLMMTLIESEPVEDEPRRKP